jgi:hypothetical protein
LHSTGTFYGPIWNILRSIGILYGRLVYCSHFGTICTKTKLATLLKGQGIREPTLS